MIVGYPLYVVVPGRTQFFRSLYRAQTDDFRWVSYYMVHELFQSERSGVE